VRNGSGSVRRTHFSLTTPEQLENYEIRPDWLFRATARREGCKLRSTAPILHVVLPDNLCDPRVRILLLSLHPVLIGFPSLCLVPEFFRSPQTPD
jgi:hypothetical protein